MFYLRRVVVIYYFFIVCLPSYCTNKAYNTKSVILLALDVV